MNIYAEFHDRIAAILLRFGKEGRLPANLDPARFVVEPPRDASLGDLACNAAMVFAKEAKAFYPQSAPARDGTGLRTDPGAGGRPGRSGRAGLPQYPPQEARVFVDLLRVVLVEGGDFGRGAAAAGWPAAKRSMSNMSRPIRPGRCMSATAAARCSATRWPACWNSPAHEVTREYYINDAGAQVDVLARSAFLRYREALGETVTIPEGLYPGDYLKPVGAALARKIRRQPARPAGKRMAGAGARRRHRRDDGDDPRRSRRAQHHA